MMFVLFCHQLYNIHVKGNFILFTTVIEIMQIFGRKTSQYYFYWTPVFAVSPKNKQFVFQFSVKFKVVLMVFVALFHTLDNIRVKGNFIFFSINIKIIVISWG